MLATSRHYRETEAAAASHGLRLRYVGSRGGRDLKEQLVLATERQSRMIDTVSSFEPDVSVSVGSAVCARISFGLKVKHVTINDSPHSVVAGKLSIPLSYHLMCPWVIPYESWFGFGIRKAQISRYHALDPAAWLKRRARKGPVPKLDASRKTITVRLEESYAPYMAGTDQSWNDAVLGAVASAFQDCNLVALCRYGDQLRRVRKKYGAQYVVPDYVDGRTMLSSTDVFVGMGGTMTAESALMGVPTISVFQGSLFTESYLRSVGLLEKAQSPGGVVRLARSLLRERDVENGRRRAKRILDLMEDPVASISSFIASIPSK